MTAQQAGIVYRYFRAEADQDISGTAFQLSADDGATWKTATYIAPGNWPPSVVAADAAKAVPGGRTGYWYRVLTGPGITTAFPMNLGTNLILGHCTDNPEVPQFFWRISVGVNE